MVGPGHLSNSSEHCTHLGGWVSLAWGLEAGTGVPAALGNGDMGTVRALVAGGERVVGHLVCGGLEHGGWVRVWSAAGVGEGCPTP